MNEQRDSRENDTSGDESRSPRGLWLEAAGWLTISLILPAFLGQVAVGILHFGFGLRGNLVALIFWIPSLLGVFVGCYIAYAVLKAGPVRRSRHE